MKIIADIAKKTNPNSVAEIDARVAALAKAQAAAREEKLASQGFLDGWSGTGEAGGNVSTGNTSNTGIAVGVTVTKESRRWKHNLRGLVDYQRQDGTTTRERYFAGYEGNFNITPRFFALGTLAWERDTFSGFDRRFSESLGLGYRLVAAPTLRLSVEAGPALRQTNFTNGVTSNTFAGRAAGNFWWQIRSGLEFSQNATVFYDSFNTSFQALSSLTFQLTGALKARASFQFNSESNPPLGSEKTDTISRLTLVYGF